MTGGRLVLNPMCLEGDAPRRGSAQPQGQAIVSTTPPSTRSAAPVVADAWGDAT